MDNGCCLIKMTVKAVGRIGAKDNDVLDGGSGRCGRIHITGSVMAVITDINPDCMGGEDIRPIEGTVAVGALL